jgi:hypothetical protein
LRRLNELVKENILSYKIHGRNKVFFINNNLKAKNYIFNAERYKLIKLLGIYPKLNAILSEILNKYSPNLMILYGNYANFSAHANDEINIFVEANNRKIKKKIESLNYKINIEGGVFDKNSSLIKEIIKNHIILKGVELFYEKINN